MRVTSKGQVTIPKAMREKHGLLPGTEVEFVSDGPEIHVRKARGARPRGEAIVAQLREAGQRANFTMSTEEIMRLTRGEDWGTGHLEEGEGDPP